jgi:ribosomal protein L37AE/L43A
VTHPLRDDRYEPFTCPRCTTVSVARPLVRTLACRSCEHVWFVRSVDGLAIASSDDELAAVTRIAHRLTAVRMSLYRTSQGLRAYIVDAGGGEHTGVRVTS